MTTTEVARQLGVDRSVVQDWVDQGKLPGSIRTAGGHRRIPVEALEQLRSNNGRGKALLYLRVAGESERKFLDLGLAHLTRYAVEHRYNVARVMAVVQHGLGDPRPDLDEIRSQIRSGEPGYEVIIVERADRLLLMGGDEFIRWAGPAVRVLVAGASCAEADEAYRREMLIDLYYPLADALAFRGVPPAKIERVISQGLEGMAEALGLLGGKSVCGSTAQAR